MARGVAGSFSIAIAGVSAVALSHIGMLYFALLMQSQYRHLRIGLAGLGLEAYWNQFTGLEERLKGYLDQVQNKITTASRAVVNLGLIDTPQKSLQAAHQARREDIEILLVYVTTYALSSTVLPLIKRAGVPVILLNLAACLRD